MKKINKIAIGEYLLEGLKPGDRDKLDKSSDTIEISTQAEFDAQIVTTTKVFDEIDYSAIQTLENEYQTAIMEWIANGRQGERPQDPWENPPKKTKTTREIIGKKLRVNCDLAFSGDYEISLIKTTITFDIKDAWEDYPKISSTPSHNRLFNLDSSRIENVSFEEFRRPLANMSYNSTITLHKANIPLDEFPQEESSPYFIKGGNVFIPLDSELRTRGVCATHFTAFEDCTSLDLSFIANDGDSSDAKFTLAKNCRNVTITSSSLYANDVPMFENCQHLRTHDDIYDGNYSVSVKGTNNTAFQDCSDIDINTLGMCRMDETAPTSMFKNCKGIKIKGIYSAERKGQDFAIFDACDQIEFLNQVLTPSPYYFDHYGFRNCRNVQCVRFADKSNRQLVNPAKRWTGVNTGININSCDPNEDGTYGSLGSTTKQGGSTSETIFNYPLVDNPITVFKSSDLIGTRRKFSLYFTNNSLYNEITLAHKGNGSIIVPKYIDSGTNYCVIFDLVKTTKSEYGVESNCFFGTMTFVEELKETRQYMRAKPNT